MEAQQNLLTNPTVSTDVVWHHHKITRERRELLNGHRGSVIWLTGLPGSGKSTVANALEQLLHRAGCRSYVLDGDNVRHGLCGDLGFSEEDREENIRRVAEVSRLFLDAGVIVICAFVSSYRKDRDRARAQFRNGDFVEVYCRCPVEVCEERDPKGHYKKARRGEIKDFTGVTSPYEAPEFADLVLDTAVQSVDDCVDQAHAHMRARGILPSSPAVADPFEALVSRVRDLSGSVARSLSDLHSAGVGDDADRATAGDTKDVVRGNVGGVERGAG